MPVGVVLPHGDECHRRARGGEELLVGVRAAVVGKLEDVGSQVGVRTMQPRLRLGAEIAGEQQPDAVDDDPHDERQVVGRGSRCRALRSGRQHLDRHRADGAAVAGHQHDDLPAGAADGSLEPCAPVVGGRQGAGGHGAHVPAGERSGQPADVIRIEVRRENQG